MIKKYMYLQKSIKDYLNELAAKQPTPGGGSAAALCGAIGVALLEMCLQFTIGKGSFRHFESEAKQILKILGQIKLKLEGLIDEDVKVYQEIVSAFKSKDKNLIDKALKNGYDISFGICMAILEALRNILEIERNSNPNLITDVGAGAEFLNAAFRAAFLNIDINLKGLGDKKLAKQAQEKAKRYFKECNRIYQVVTERVRKKMGS